MDLRKGEERRGDGQRRMKRERRGHGAIGEQLTYDQVDYTRRLSEQRKYEPSRAYQRNRNQNLEENTHNLKHIPIGSYQTRAQKTRHNDEKNNHTNTEQWGSDAQTLAE